MSVSKSSRSLHSHPRKPGKRATVPAAAAPDTSARPPGRPWVIDGIDYDPAITAVHDLITWAFALAERDVAEWPEGQRRVRSARRFVLARLRGKRLHGVPLEDVLFTTGLLARIFEADLRLPLSDMVEILAQLGLPTEAVPVVPRVPPVARRPQDAPLASITPLRPCPATVPVRPVAGEVCGGCGQSVSRFRIAA
jgi:hypothetical protein